MGFKLFNPLGLGILGKLKRGGGGGGETLDIRQMDNSLVATALTGLRVSTAFSGYNSVLIDTRDLVAGGAM